MTIKYNHLTFSTEKATSSAKFFWTSGRSNTEMGKAHYDLE